MEKNDKWERYNIIISKNKINFFKVWNVSLVDTKMGMLSRLTTKISQAIVDFHFHTELYPKLFTTDFYFRIVSEFF